MITDKEKFESDYCKESDITLEEYHQIFVTLPCTCDYEECKGWAVVNNEELSIKTHNTLYNR